jgi:hypothetical protein
MKKKPVQRRKEVVLFQVRPVKEPPYWPTANGGWVTVHPNGTGWTAGNIADRGIPVFPRRGKSDLRSEIGNMLITWNSENGDDWAVRLLPVIVLKNGECRRL